MSELNRGKPCRVISVVTRSIMILIGIFLQSQSMAFNIYNETDQPVKASVSGGNFNIEIPPHDYRGCNWQEKSCNASGVQTELLQAVAVIEGVHFKCILPMQAGGYTKVQQRDRSDLGLPPELYCTSYTFNGQLTRTEPYGVASTVADVQFLVTGDPQFGSATAYDSGSRNTLNRMIQERNDSCSAAGCAIRGILVAGDLTENSYNSQMEMYKQSIAGSEQYVFDGLGNHDVLNTGVTQSFIIQDRQRTATMTRVRDPHYSWDWNNIHFVQLNLAPNIDGDGQFFNAFQFLQEDLQKHVGGSGRPVILIHHIGINKSKGWDTDWWSAQAIDAYWRAISLYNVAAVFVGHTHRGREEKRPDWNPIWLRPDSSGPESIPTFISGAAGYGAFLNVNISDSNLTVQRMGLTDTNDPKSPLRVYDTVSYPIPTRGKAACPSGVLNNLGNDHVAAQFSVPASANNTVISFKDGTAHTYLFPRCYRVWWESMSYTCSDGNWMESVTQRVGRDAWCNPDSNTDQPNLKTIIY